MGTKVKNEALMALLHKARLNGSDLRIEFDPSRGYRVVEITGAVTQARTQWGDRWDVSIYLQGRTDSLMNQEGDEL